MTNLEFKHNTFKWATLRLMAAKYAYYILNENYIEDYVYDLDEKEWFKIGRELGLLKEDETSPCIDFDFNHPIAKDAERMAKVLVRSYKGSRATYEQILKEYKQL